MNPFKVGDKVVCVDDTVSSYLLNKGSVYTVEGFHNLSTGDKCIILEELSDYRLGFFTHRFKLVEEQLKPASFKDFLSLMCRVELRNGDMAIFIDDCFVGNSSVIGLVSRYSDTGMILPPYNVECNKELEIVRVFAKPTYLVGILNPKEVGELLWECPELAAERKKKEEKKATLLEEIKEWEAKRESNLLQANSATSVISDLEKQLKEIE